MKLKRGDKVVVTAGKDKGSEGKILLVDRKSERVVVEGVNMIKKHVKAGRRGGVQGQGGIISKEAPIHVSNVMYLHKGKPTRIGYKLQTVEKKGKTVTVKQRVAKSTGDIID